MKVGSICTGYGGLEMGLKQVFPQAQLAWVADNDKAASLLFETHYPGTPNLGDIKQVDWSKVEKVDALTAGIPCQPFSDVGKREGHDDNRDLTGAFLEAVDALRPGIVILENVSGFRKRGMGRVLGGLSSMGFDARWHSVRASEAGAPHRRERVFVLAYSADNGQQRPWATWLGRYGLEDGGQVVAYPNSSGLQGSGQEEDASGGEGSIDWREYEPAVRRWERIHGCLAPAPTEVGPKGNARLSPHFVEWMMGIPKGWVTDALVTRKDLFTRLGDGVVPRQAALAIRGLMYE